MRWYFIFSFFIFSFLSAASQSFIFDDAESYADFQMRKENNRLVCFYKTTASTDLISHYRTIRFDSNLQVVDTIGFYVKGKCRNLGSGENEKYIWHILHKTLGSSENITFLITDKTGKQIATWEKTSEDFIHFFGKSFKKLERLHFNTLNIHGDFQDILLIEPEEYERNGDLAAVGRWCAFNITEGSLKWELSKTANFVNYKAYNGKFVAFQASTSGKFSLHFYNLENGAEVGSSPVVDPGSTREISMFEIGKDEIVVAGSDNKAGNGKHNKFFITRFDYSGSRVLDKTDTADRLGNNRLKLIDGAVTPDGNFILIGESFRLNQAKNVAAGVVISVLAGGVFVPPSNPIITGFVSAAISPQGEVKEFHLFPVDKRKGHSTLIVDENQVYLRYKNALLKYDLTDLKTPPRLFTTISDDQQIVTFAGKLIGVRKDVLKYEIILENLSGAN